MKRLILISGSLLVASASFAQSGCVTAPLNVTGGQTTITTSGDKTVTNEQSYLYFERKHQKHEQPYRKPGIDNDYPSTPLLLSSDKMVEPVSETYNVSLSTPQSTVAVCPDSILNLNANINVEKVSSYTGNYPGSYSDNNTYKMVSKHKYKMAARKMRKIRRDEAKIESKSGMTVDARSQNS